MPAAVIVLAVLLAIALIGWAWCARSSRKHRLHALRVEQYNNWIETKYSYAVARLIAHGERFD
ncbi:hypothetical protein [Burkholderia ubonensis]|uniref:Uncharacterized protein n=1 Tax=Burkholderia ubonensis TaxID=101571 RepID=A0ABD4E190_9BURK|nr:hypothetical protein [Burkholderia ubonensis]KVN83455.1 hypothetical protein WJ68_16215 [Burkholderia ubonensis]